MSYKDWFFTFLAFFFICYQNYFYFVGKCHATKNCVILIHGLHQTAWIMRPLAKRLQAAGFDTHQFGYRSMRDGIQTNSARLNNWLEKPSSP